MEELKSEEILREILSRARKAGLTIDELCSSAKIATSSFHRWINGSMSPTLGRLNLLIRALNEREASL